MKTSIKVVSLLAVASLALGAVLSGLVYVQGRHYERSAESVPEAQTAIVLGAYVSPQGQLCTMLADRVSTAVALYRAGRVHRLLVSGDHGQQDYDEVNAMRRHAEAMGVPAQDIFMDHAGFSTWDTMVRARKVFCVDSAIVVTQSFHLPRAVYLARSQGIEAWGVSADRQGYPSMLYYQARDGVARCKACLEALLEPSPRYLGPPIPITGDGRLTKG